MVRVHRLPACELAAIGRWLQLSHQRLYHSASVRYEQPNWSLVVGVRNLFDKDPPTVSTGVATRYGNVPAFATQYDLYGRSAFANFNYQF